MITLFAFISFEIFGQSVCIPLEQIFSDIKKVNVSLNDIATTKEYSDFNFHEFEPISGQIDPNNFYVVGFSKNGEILNIKHIHKELESWNFEMRVLNLSNLRVFTYADERSNGGYNSFYFIQFKDTKKAFMINGKKQFGRDAAANEHFPKFDPGTIETISSILVLNEKFFPTHNFRISERTFVFGSEIFYDSNGKLETERVSFFNIPGSGRNLKLNKSTCLNELVAYFFEAGETFTISAKPSINDKYLRVPLWINGGIYLYR